MALVIGAPLYIGLSWPYALLVHAILIVIYALLFKYFSSSFTIEGGLLVLILSVEIAILVPVFRQAREAKHRHDQRKLERRQATEREFPNAKTKNP